MGWVMDFLNWLLTSPNGSFPVTGNCSSKVHINEDIFYPILLLPAVLITVSLALTTPRKKRMPGCFWGRPGFVIPMDAFGRSNRLSYAAAFGATAFLCYEILLDRRAAFPCPGHKAVKSICKIVSVFIYGTCYFPVFASLAVNCVYGYAIGTLYVWVLTAKKLVDLVACEYLVEVQLIDWLRQVPHILCLVFLCISVPVRCVRSVRDKKPFFRAREDVREMSTLEQIRDSYQGIHVRELLKPPALPSQPPVEIEGRVAKVKAWFVSVGTYIKYDRKKHFQYPARLVSVMAVSAAIMYQVSVEWMALFVIYANTLLNMLETFQIRAPFDKLIRDFLNAFCGSLVTATLIAFVVGIFGLKQMFTMYRKNLLALYRGNRRYLDPVWSTNNVTNLIGFIRYSGYQVAYIFWGFMVQFTTIFLLLMLFSLFIIALEYKVPLELYDLILELLPTIVLLLAMYVTQYLLARYLFLKNKGEEMALENRRLFFIFTYYMFFYNIFIGMFSCLRRILIGTFVGIFMLARLDRTLLPRKFERLDRGFKAYVGYMHVEYTQTHPVVVVFLSLLHLPLIQGRPPADSPAFSNSLYVDSSYLAEIGKAAGRTETEMRRHRCIFRWHLARTLISNPQLGPLRKQKLSHGGNTEQL